MRDASLLVGTFDTVNAEPFAGADTTIWYLGDDYARLLSLRERFPGAAFANMPGAMQEASQALLPLILNLEAEIAGTNFDRSAWDASDMADRSRHNSPLFLELCRTFAVVKAVQARQCIVAACDEPGFALSLLQTALRNNVATEWIGGSLAISTARHASGEWIRVLRSAASEFRAARRRKQALKTARAREADSAKSSGNVDAWITIWAGEKTFPAGQPLARDDRFGPLPELLRGHGLRLGYIVMPLWPERYAALADSAVKCAEPVLFAEDGYGMRDIVRAILATIFSRAGLRRQVSFGGIDLTPVFKRARRRERFSGRPVQTRLFAGVVRRLATLGAKPKSILFTYEFHSWEKILVAAIRRWLPGTRSVGYNHSVFPPLYVGFHPSRGDIVANHVPDRLIVMGEAEADIMRSHGFPADRIVNGGALRYNNFLENAAKITSPPARKHRLVLCCLGVDRDEAIELAVKSAQAVEAEPNCALAINFHPMCGPEFRVDVKTLISRNCDISKISFDDRSVRELLPMSDVVLYTDTNAAFEAVASGRQIIYVGRDTGLDYDKVPAGITTRCTTVQQIRAALQGKPENAEAARAVLARYFGPVRVDAFLSAIAACSVSRGQ